MPQKNRAIPGLECIRGCAALIVFYNHLFTYNLIEQKNVFALPAQFATEAVIVFFVLSGAVIELSTERRIRNGLDRKTAISEYARSRFFRIYPAFLIALAFSAMAQWMLQGTLGLSIGWLGNILMLQSLAGYIVSTPIYNAPLWSLSAESFYYAIYGLVILVPALSVAWLILAILIAAFLYPPDYSLGVINHIVFTLSFSIPWMLGVFIVKARHVLTRIGVADGIAFFLIAIAAARIQIADSYYDIWRLSLFALLTGPLILAFVQAGDDLDDRARDRVLPLRLTISAAVMLGLWFTSKSLLYVKIALSLSALAGGIIPSIILDKAINMVRMFNAPMVYLGSISYGLYVLHAPIIAMIASFKSFISSPVLVATAVLICFAVAHLVDRLLQPMLTNNFKR